MILKAFPWHTLLMNMYHIRSSIYISINEKTYLWNFRSLKYTLLKWYCPTNQYIRPRNIFEIISKVDLNGMSMPTRFRQFCAYKGIFWSDQMISGSSRNSWRYLRPSSIRFENVVNFCWLFGNKPSHFWN